MLKQHCVSSIGGRMISRPMPLLAGVALTATLTLLGCSSANDTAANGQHASPIIPPTAQADPAQALPPETPAMLDFTMNSLQGRPVRLADYQGQVILIVNTASKCGYTKQYAGLEALYRQYKDQGLVVLGFPANNFGGQEPGSDQQIAEFCQANYGVTFPMFSKISVKGDDQHPLYQRLTAIDTPAVPAGDVKWNFEKFLIGRDGQVVGRYASKVAPESAELTGAIEAALASR